MSRVAAVATREPTCDVCRRERATAATAERHGDVCDNGNDPWNHWCNYLCWCNPVHHDVMATDPTQGPGWCDTCKPKPLPPKIRRPRGGLEAAIDAACGTTEDDYKDEP